MEEYIRLRKKGKSQNYQDFLEKETARVIVTLTNELTPKQKMLFALRYLEEMEVAEIVEITGLSPEKIKSNLYLARQTIVKKLENY
jgi:RNA polymerase sigma-70 factor (ECF subfamily)